MCIKTKDVYYVIEVLEEEGEKLTSKLSEEKKQMVIREERLY